MKVLIACECSGTVRRAFRILGHDAWSMDLKPSEDNSPFHIQDDVGVTLDHGWDLLIAHPPCTFLCNSGVGWLYRHGKLNQARHAQMRDAADFFASLYHAPIPHVCIENPVMHGYARDYLQSAWRVPTYTQTIQPYQFGHAESKRTCLWLRNLPLLMPTDVLALPKTGHWENQTPSGQNKLAPSPTRAADRARTYRGIASAMSIQWSNV